MKSTLKIIIGIAVLAALGGVLYFIQPTDTNAPRQRISYTTKAECEGGTGETCAEWLCEENCPPGYAPGWTPASVPTSPPAAPPSAGGSPQTPPSGAIITYTDDGFSPETVIIKKGGTVTWINNSSDKMWVGADPHPVHTEYPEKGGCISALFDQCARGEPSTTWSFTFTIEGVWKFHNHLNATHRGIVMVQD